MSFRQIQDHLQQHPGQKVSLPTIERAWRFADPGAAQAAWGRGGHRALPPEKLEQLRRLLNENVHTTAEIARLLEVSKATVNRYRGYLQQHLPWPEAQHRNEPAGPQVPALCNDRRNSNPGREIPQRPEGAHGGRPA